MISGVNYFEIGSITAVAFSFQATAILIIIEGQFQTFQRYSSSKLVLKTVKSCFVALNYCGNGSIAFTFKLVHHAQVVEDSVVVPQNSDSESFFNYWRSCSGSRLFQPRPFEETIFRCHHAPHGIVETECKQNSTRHAKCKTPLPALQQVYTTACPNHGGVAAYHHESDRGEPHRGDLLRICNIQYVWSSTLCVCVCVYIYIYIYIYIYSCQWKGAHSWLIEFSIIFGHLCVFYNYTHISSLGCPCGLEPTPAV